MLLIQINTGSLPFLINLLCSLTRINAPSLANIVVWALDENVVSLLEDIKRKNGADFVQTEWNSRLPLDTRFGVFYEDQWKGSEGHQEGGTEEYFQM